MSDSYLKKYRSELDHVIDLYFKEDIGSGDLTSQACLNNTKISSGKIYSKEDCMIAGVEFSQYIIKKYDPTLKFESSIKDGQTIESGHCVGELKGSSVSILNLERLLLNCMARMSAIATHVATLKKIISHRTCQLLDTRKTTPGFRVAEKWAVSIGGGLNHRMGLYDAILIKDNHVDLCGGVKKALEKTSKFISNFQSKPTVIVEARDLYEVIQILDYDFIDRVLLDNFSPNVISHAIKTIDKKHKIEVSGNINQNNILDYAQEGVDYVSMGSLTHSRPLIDMTLLMEPS
ncbi:MAG: carboxylating nicotinate-nucleotide diphosphorylase [Flavobacteriaceae bacterium]|nr:carboxylating nicotinate-nucleotide diphosphorylase [Flavobacteriaceae bacterium]MCY4215930.1 carboxylating nicotinate-nucleotide diphosphorylase [Flavobacteriaceae bacterium]MCY4254480.1 carboxylating nicotinate-nucleotide diphosphorylase [Flavobacteriaceae bacterium]